MSFEADNAINGVPSCLHGDFMNGLLRKEWGFDGLIVSDQDSVRDAWAGQRNLPGHFYGKSFPNVTALGIKAGCDQNDGQTYSQNGMAAVQQGLMTEHDVRQYSPGAFLVLLVDLEVYCDESNSHLGACVNWSWAGGPSSE